MSVVGWNGAAAVIGSIGNVSGGDGASAGRGCAIMMARSDRKGNTIPRKAPALEWAGAFRSSCVADDTMEAHQKRGVTV